MFNMVRDEERIDDVLLELEEYWKEHPQLRLAQIITNISIEKGIGPDPYNMEDDTLLNELEFKNENNQV